MVEMAGKEYLLKLRAEQTQMREEIVRLLDEKGQLSFHDIYLQMEEKYHRYCPFPYEKDRILEGVVKNQLAVLVNQRQLMEIPAENGVVYAPAGSDRGQEITHAA